VVLCKGDQVNFCPMCNGSADCRLRTYVVLTSIIFGMRLGEVLLTRVLRFPTRYNARHDGLGAG